MRAMGGLAAMRARLASGIGHRCAIATGLVLMAPRASTRRVAILLTLRAVMIRTLMTGTILPGTLLNRTLVMGAFLSCFGLHWIKRLALAAPSVHARAGAVSLMRIAISVWGAMAAFRVAIACGALCV